MLRRYSSATQIRWVQEEPRNQGAWEFVAPRLRALDSRDIGYVGREEAASPATGSYKIHQAEEAAILDEALRRPRSAGADGPRLQDRAAG
jgi:2-oxoglutarate dehydrogenase E1 component